MKIIDIESIIKANQWFAEANEESVLSLLETQPVLTGLVQVLIEEDLKNNEEYSKDLLYSLYGTILKTYLTEYEDKLGEVSEKDIDASFEKQNKFAELLSSSLGFGDEVVDGEEERAMQIMDKLSALEEKFTTEEDFNFEEEGLGELSKLIQNISDDVKQPSLNAFLQTEIEEADLDDDESGFINQQLAIVVDAIETMLERVKE